MRVTLTKGFRVGAWLTGLTITRNERVTMLLLEAPSLTLTVTIAEPKPYATGVKEIKPVELGLL